MERGVHPEFAAHVSYPHDVPFGRTLTLAVHTQRPREVEERIVSVLRRMVTGRADERPRAWGTSTTAAEHRAEAWRVPTIGELNAVATAKMLSKAIFWSMTPGDSFGDLRLVVGTKKATTIAAVPKSWDGAKIVCIRPRQPWMAPRSRR
jgi:hypothetical protein